MPCPFSRLAALKAGYGTPGAGSEDAELPASFHPVAQRFARPDIDQHLGSNASPFRAGFEIAGFGANGLCRGGEFAGSKTRPSPVLLIIVVAVVVSLIGRVMRRVALIVPQLSIHAIGGEQLGMRAALDRLAARYHDDLIHIDHRCQAVGREDHGAALPTAYRRVRRPRCRISAEDS